MPNPMVPPSGRVTVPSALFLRMFVTVFLIMTIISVAITFILPETYASTARLMVEPDKTVDGKTIQYFPTYIPTTIGIIQSPLILDSVMDQLDLKTKWNRKYFNGEALSSDKVFAMLLRRLTVTPVPNTKLITITAYSDDRNEAAQIANTVAEVYRESRRAAAVKLGGPPTESSSVQITDRAVPGKEPVRPNKPLNIGLGMVAGALLGLVAGGAAVWITTKLGKRGIYFVPA